MRKDDLDKIYLLAEAFRQAIEDYIRTCGPKTRLLQTFPKGNCQLASGFLQKFLFENGLKTDLVLGKYGYGENGESHAWLMIGNEIIIDITGDQYEMRPNKFRYDKPVYVGPRDSFHELFSITYREPYEELDSRTILSPKIINKKIDCEKIDYESIRKRALIIISDTNT